MSWIDITTCEEIIIPDDMLYRYYDGEHRLSVEVDYSSMRHFLALCKSGLNIDDIYSSRFASFTRLIDQLELKTYTINFDSPWGGLSFEIPIVDGKIVIEEIQYHDDEVDDDDFLKYLPRFKD